MIKMTMVRQVLVGVCCLGVFILALFNTHLVKAAGPVTYGLQNDSTTSSRKASYYIYLPTTVAPIIYNRSGNSASTLNTKPYAITAQYQFHLDSRDSSDTNETMAYVSLHIVILREQLMEILLRSKGNRETH